MIALGRRMRPGLLGGLEVAAGRVRSVAGELHPHLKGPHPHLRAAVVGVDRAAEQDGEALVGREPAALLDQRVHAVEVDHRAEVGEGEAAVVGAGEGLDAAQGRVEVGAEAVDGELEEVDPKAELQVAEAGGERPGLGDQGVAAAAAARADVRRQPGVEHQRPADAPRVAGLQRLQQVLGLEVGGGGHVGRHRGHRRGVQQVDAGQRGGALRVGGALAPLQAAHGHLSAAPQRGEAAAHAGGRGGEAGEREALGEDPPAGLEVTRGEQVQGGAGEHGDVGRGVSTCPCGQVRFGGGAAAAGAGEGVAALDVEARGLAGAELGGEAEEGGGAIELGAALGVAGGEGGVVAGAGEVTGAAEQAGEELGVGLGDGLEVGGEVGVDAAQGAAVEVGEHDLAGALVVGVEELALGGAEGAQEAHAEQLLDDAAGVLLDLGGAQGDAGGDGAAGDGDGVEQAALGLGEPGDADLQELVEGDLGGGIGAVGDEAGEVVEELRAALGLGGEAVQAGAGGVGPEHGLGEGEGLVGGERAELEDLGRDTGREGHVLKDM